MPIFGLPNDMSELGLIRSSEAKSNPRVDGGARYRGEIAPLAKAGRNSPLQFAQIEPSNLFGLSC